MSSRIVAVVASALFCFICAAAAPQHADPRNAAIITLGSDISPEGSFTYSYETENGIRAEARGILNNPGNPELESQSVQGAYSFVADDGQTYTVTYIADENGFQPQGAHLPTPPPIPEAIARALQYLPKDNPAPADQDAIVTPAYFRRPDQDGVVNPAFPRRPYGNFYPRQ